MPQKKSSILILIFSLSLLLNACKGLPGADAKKYPPNPEERVKRNLEEGKGFRIDNAFNKKGGTNFEFASSNELWRASLDSLDFMPLLSANYSGGIIITDWYSEGSNTNESIKISIRFQSNEIRADSLIIKVFYKNCDQNLNCAINENQGKISNELRASILKRAAKYQKEGIEKYKKENPYTYTSPGDGKKNKKK